MKKIDQWSQEKIIKKPTEETLSKYTLTKKEYHYRAAPDGGTIVFETYSKGIWQLDPDIHHVYKLEEEKNEERKD